MQRPLQQGVAEGREPDQRCQHQQGGQHPQQGGGLGIPPLGEPRRQIVDKLAAGEQYQGVQQVDRVGEIPQPVGDAVIQQAQQRALAIALAGGNPDQQHVGADQQQGQLRRHGELHQREGEQKGEQQRQILLHHGQAWRSLDLRQQPEAEHEFTHPAPDGQCPAGDIQGTPAVHDKGQHSQGQQRGEVAPAAVGDGERNEQRKQQIANPLHAQRPGGEVPGQSVIGHHLQQQKGAWQCLGRGKGGAEGGHPFPLPHLEQGAGVEANPMVGLVELPANQQQQGHQVEGINPGQPQPEEAAITYGAGRAGEVFPIDVGQHQPAQNKEEIDPEVAVLDELGVAGDRLHPLGKEQQAGVKQHHHQGSDAPQRCQQWQ